MCIIVFAAPLYISLTKEITWNIYFQLLYSADPAILQRTVAQNNFKWAGIIQLQNVLYEKEFTPVITVGIIALV